MVGPHHEEEPACQEEEEEEEEDDDDDELRESAIPSHDPDEQTDE